MPRSQNNNTLIAVLLVLAAVVVVLVVLLAMPDRDAGGGTVAQSTSSTVLPSTTETPSSTTTPTTIPTTTSTAPEAPTYQVVGTSRQGRPIELHTFGSGPRRVLVIGGVHGDEYGGEIARKFLAYLDEHPEAVPEGVLLQIIPSANPDGEAAGTRGNAIGVDVNRNFPSANWSTDLNPGDRPTGGLTGGAGPASEPETVAMLAVLETGWDLVISLHSAGGIVDLDGEGGLEIAERISAIWGMPVADLDYQEYITGSLGVYVPERYGIPVITLELDDTELTDALRDALLAALPAIEGDDSDRG